MKLIDVLREIEKPIIGLMSPDWIRLDIGSSGFAISANSNKYELIARVDFAGKINGVIAPFATSNIVLLKLALSLPEYASAAATATYVPRSGDEMSHIILIGCNGDNLKITVCDLDRMTINGCQFIPEPPGGVQLLLAINASWKQNFEYWSSAFDGGKAAFFRRNGQLFCMIGDKRFDHQIWHCEEGDKSQYISAIQFSCKSMLRVISEYGNFKSLAISVSVQGWLKITGKMGSAECTYYIVGETPYWFASMMSPVYDIDDPRSVLNQRQDGG